MKKPNVILLTIDTLRADRLGCYGFERPLTPNLDRLAECGVRFDQAITGGSWTQAAFPVMLTSTYASMYGGCLGPLSEKRPSAIAILAEAGYTTAGFSTSPLLSRTYDYNRNFHHFSDLKPKETDPVIRKIKGGQRLLRQPITHAISGHLGLQTRPAKIYVTAEQLTDKAVSWIDQTKTPFFAWLHYMDIHWPYHREESLTAPESIAQAWRDLSHLHQVNWNDASLTSAQRDHYVRLYEHAVAYTDVQIGRLLDFLEETGLGENTILVAVSDHGEEFLEHGRWGHWENNLYDEILKVPLIIKLIGQQKGTIVNKQVRLLDLMPTILDLCDLQPPKGMEGISMVDTWTKYDASSYPTVAVSEMWRDTWHIIAVRTEKFKYIWDSKEPEKVKLFDLTTDPGETQNVRLDHPIVAEELHQHVEDRLEGMKRTKPDENVLEPELSDEMMGRLRDLGYVE